MPTPLDSHRTTTQQKIRKLSPGPSTGQILRIIDPKPTYIQQLPVEVLSLVFESTCLTHSESGEINYIAPNESEPPLLFLKVCKYWAQVAVRTRSLWNRVCVPDFSSSSLAYADCDRMHKLMSAWLSYSGSAPLYISHLQPGCKAFDAETPESDAEEGRALKSSVYKNEIRHRANYYARAFLDDFCDYETRWHTLEIELDDELLEDFYDRVVRCTWFHEKSEPCRGRALNLQKLKIILPREVQWPSHIEKLHKWISSLQYLETLELIETASSLVTENLEIIPFERLKAVKIVFKMQIPLEKALQISQRCKSAKEITLGTLWGIPDDTPLNLKSSNAVYNLDNVTKLKLKGIVNPLGLLESLVLPKLEDLEIEIEHGFEEYPHAPQVLKGVLERSKCRLKRFKIIDPRFSSEQMTGYRSLAALRDVEFVAVLRRDPDQTNFWDYAYD